MASKNENTPRDKKKWTLLFMEQFAREWLKHKVLLPNPHTEGISQNQMRGLKAAARREMFSNLGVSKSPAWTQTFLRYYNRTLRRIITSARAKTKEEALAAAPPWVRDFELHFDMIPKVLQELRVTTATDKNLLLSNMIRAMWKELRDKGSHGHKLEFWTRAINAAAKECSIPTILVRRTWHSVKRVAMQKLHLLQMTGDKVPAGSPINLTPAEWLAVDLLLTVEPQENLLDQDSLNDYDQLATLTAMFSLAQMYQLDECLLGITKDSEKRWQNATQVYLHRGFSSSIIVLQRRWYEMVQVTRDKLAAFRRTGSDVPPLCKQMALRFPQLLTMPLPSWAELVRARRVVVPDYANEHANSELADADVIIPHDDGPKDDDIILIEKDIETIDLDGFDSNDEDRLIIDERIKIDKKKLELRKRQIKEEIDTINLEKKLIEERKQEICTKLDSELDSQLKDIEENQDNRKTQSSNVNSSIDWSLFKRSRNKSSNSLSLSLFELTDSDSLDGSSEADLGVDTLKTEIDITEHNISETNLTSEVVIDNPINKTIEKSNDSIRDIHSETETINSENIALKETSLTEVSNIAVFEELDPSNVEAKIIFSDEEDEGNNIDFINPSINDKDPHVANEQTNILKKHDELMDKQIIVKTEDTSTEVAENETILNNNIQIQQTDLITNLDTDSSDLETSSIEVKTENESLQIEKVIDEPNNESTNILIPSLSKKKRIGPKSFMQKYQKEGMCIEPNSAINSLKSGQRLIFESEENDSTALESVVNVEPNKVVSDSDKNNESVETICKKEVTSDEEDSNLIIVENREQSEIKQESSLEIERFEKEIAEDENTCNSLIPSKAISLDVNKTVDNRLSSYIETILDKEKDIELNCDKSKNIINTISNEKSHERFSFEYDNTDINDRKPIIPMENDEAINADNNKNDTEVTDTPNYSTINLKSEDTESYLVEQDRSDSRMDCQSEKDENDDAPSTVDMGASLSNEQSIEDKLLMRVQIPLFKIDQFSFWKKHAKENTIDLSNIKQNVNPVKPRLKPGLRPDWAKPVKRLNRSYEQNDLRKNPDFNAALKKLLLLDAEFIKKNAYVLTNILKPVTIDLERLPLDVVTRYLERRNSSDQEEDIRPRKKVELSDIEEVRRINRRLLTAQVRPIVATQTIDLDSESESDVSSVMDVPSETRNRIADKPADNNTLTQKELDDVLKKLARNEKKRTIVARKRDYCCPARRHINCNRARARVAARAGKKSQSILNLHARHGEEHAKLKCACCCLNALRGLEMNKIRLSHDQQALDRDLRKLVQNVHKHESFQLPIPDDAPPEPSTSPKDFPIDSDEEVPLVDESRKDKERRARLKRKRDAERKREKIKIARMNRQKKEEEQKQFTEEDDYEEWIRQRNICAQYFTINPSGSITNQTKPNRPKNLVTFKPTVQQKKSVCTTSELTKEKVKLNEHFQGRAEELINNWQKAALLKQSDAGNKEIDESDEFIVVDDEENNKQNEKDGNVEGNNVSEEHSYTMKAIPLPILIQKPPTETQSNGPQLTILPMTLQPYNLADEDPMTIILPDTPKPTPTRKETPISILEDLCEVVELKDDNVNPDNIPRYIIKTSRAVNGQPPTIELKVDSSCDSEQSQIQTQANRTAQAPVSEAKANQDEGQTSDSSNQSKRTKQHIVTHVSGNPDSPGTRYWNNAITQPQIRTLIETAQANPGLKFMKVLQCPNKNETVLATCIAKTEDPNQTTLRLITQRSNDLANSPLFMPDCIDLTQNDKPAQTGQPLSQPEQTIAQVSQLVRSLGKPVPASGQLNQVDKLGQPVQTVRQVNPLVQPLSEPVQKIDQLSQLGKLVVQGLQIGRQSNQLVHPLVGQKVRPVNELRAPISMRVTSSSQSVHQAQTTIPLSSIKPVQTSKEMCSLPKIVEQQAQKPQVLTIGLTDTGKVAISTSSKTQQSNENLLNEQRNEDLIKSWIKHPSPLITNTNQIIQTENVIVIVVNDDTVEKDNENCVKISMPIISDAVGDSDKPSTSKMPVTSDSNKPLISQMPVISDSNKPSTFKMPVTSDSNKPSISQMPVKSNSNKPSTSKMRVTSESDKPSTYKIPVTSIRIVKTKKPPIESESSGKSLTARVNTKESTQSLVGLKVQSSATISLQDHLQPTRGKIHRRKRRFQRTDLSYSTPQYVGDVVKYIQRNKTPLSEVQILSVNTMKPLLKIRNQYLIVTERIEADHCVPSFWTLNPPMFFSQIHFWRYDKKKINDDTYTNRNLSVESITNNDTVKLKVKAFAKLPGTENVLNENLEIDMKDQNQDKPLDKLLVDAQDVMYLDRKCFKKLSDDPLIYAQVFSVISDLSVVEDLAVQNASLFLVNTHQPRLMPIIRRESVEDGRSVIDLSCPDAKDAIKSLVTIMNTQAQDEEVPPVLPRPERRRVTFTSVDSDVTLAAADASATEVIQLDSDDET